MRHLRGALLFATVSFLCAANALATHPPKRRAPSVDTGLAICSRVQDAVNGLVDFTSTRCIPALANGYGFVIISDKPVFAAPAAKKAWVLTVVAAVGKEMNDRALSGGEMLLSDVASTRQRVAWSFPVNLARSLQHQIQHDQISLDDMYATVTRNLKKVNASAPSR